MLIHSRVEWYVHISLLDWYSSVSCYSENITFHSLTLLANQVNFRTTGFPAHTPFQEVTKYVRITMKSKR